jgi:hypothetical protein
MVLKEKKNNRARDTPDPIPIIKIKTKIYIPIMPIND